MMPRLRSLSLPAVLAVLPLAIAALAGCTSTSSTATSTTSPFASSGSASASSATASASASPIATGVNAVPTPSQPPSSPAATVAASTAASAGPKVFLAEGGDVRGTAVYRPGCASGCGLSGDGTTALWNMTWTAWDSTQADGTGTEKLDDCNPNCAAGTLHAVAVRVALSRPVMVCAAGKGTWYWTQVIFTWPDGLPAAFSGDNAPANPFNYSGIAAQQATSC